MAHLVSKIRVYLGRKFEREEIHVQDDNIGGVSNPYIKEWKSSEAQPTEAQLNALESQANDLETLDQVYTNRQAEYPSVRDLVVALYDTDDKAAIEAKRAEIKLKYPK
tara:strand:+ start:611 stop:934 length:324 start_codon:yes stop_codon:yes gene_type:complete